MNAPKVPRIPPHDLRGTETTMTLSALDLYSIGIGPSSSHTVGPMRAALHFATHLVESQVVEAEDRVRIELFGSLGATGRGHGSDRAVILGLSGEQPATAEVVRADELVEAVYETRQIRLLGQHLLSFDPDRDLVFNADVLLPRHSNGMQFTAYRNGSVTASQIYYSIGGGFVVDEEGSALNSALIERAAVPFPFSSGAELLLQCGKNRLSVSDVMMANESALHGEDEARDGLLRIWDVMQSCVSTGCATEGTLPGGLGVRRRAPDLYRKLVASDREPNELDVVDWVSVFAIAVNEENAAGGRVVTAPTNGAAGVIPAVLHYYWRYLPRATEDGVVRFLLTAAAIGILIKTAASISGAEVGCQGEVGSASAMAAAALCEAMGGSPEQVENAAEVALEHHLGMTCDPIGGLVQIPCIERNAVGSVKAITAARLALSGNGTHVVSLDQAIRTMRDTGRDMHTKYKETSLGGLAVSVVEC